jgi:hypothetical protein
MAENQRPYEPTQQALQEAFHEALALRAHWHPHQPELWDIQADVTPLQEVLSDLQAKVDALTAHEGQAMQQKRGMSY